MGFIFFALDVAFKLFIFKTKKNQDICSFAVSPFATCLITLLKNTPDSV